MPTNVDNVTEKKDCEARAAGVWQATAVFDTHDDVSHIPREMLPVTVSSLYPKFSPVTVTEAPPVCGVFSAALDNTGESYEKRLSLVPTTAVTVTIALFAALSGMPAWHSTVVSLFHVVVVHTCILTTELAVSSL